ncbi:MAG: hypothetical protein ABIG84_08625 [archaeon]
MVLETVTASLNNAVGSAISILPQVVGALIILIIGLLVGKLVGKIGAKILDKLGVDDVIGKTVIGDIIKSTKMSIVGFLDAIIRWFIYLIFILAAVDILKLSTVSALIASIVKYMPNFFSGLIILVGGIVIVDVVVNWIDSVVTSMKISGGKQLLIIIRAFMFLIIAILAMDQFLIDTTIIYTFLGPLAWAVAVILAFKYGVKDALVAYAKERKGK